MLNETVFSVRHSKEHSGLEKPAVPQALEKSPFFYRTQMFIAMHTTAVQKLTPLQSERNPIHTLMTNFYKPYRFSLPLDFPKLSLPFRVSRHIFVVYLFATYATLSRPSHGT
jgi:hypothetical protein